MPEKINFSKIEGVNKYNSLPNEEKEVIKNKALDEAKEMQELTGKNATKEDYDLAQALVDEKKPQQAEEKEDVEYFDINSYRKDLAGRLSGEKNRAKRKKILEEEKKDKKYQIAKNVSDFRRNLDLKTKNFALPERLDILTKLILNEIPKEHKEEIIKAAYDDLLFQHGAEGTVRIGEIEENLKESLVRRQKMLAGIDEYLKNQEGLPRELRDHQVNALSKIRNFIASGFLRGYIAHPTGAGKTVLFSSLIKLTDARTIIIVPKRVLVGQTIKELQQYLPDKKISYIGSIDEKDFNGSSEKSAEGDVVVAVEQSFKNNSKDLKEKEFDLVIWDEAHNSYTANSQESLRNFPSAVKIAFTATPDYIYTTNKPDYEEIELDGEKLYRDPEKSAGKFYPHEIDRINLKEAITEGMLAPVAAAVVKVDSVNLDQCRTGKTAAGLDYNEHDLIELMKKHWPTLIQVVVDSLENGVSAEGDVKTEFKNKQIFAVCSTVEQAQDLADELNYCGIRAECVVGSTPDKERERIFNDYQNKKIQIITSVQVLKEGWDAPEAEVCLMLRPTLSRVFYQQAIGRVLRLDKNNPNKTALIVDFLGSYKKNAPLTTPTLFGVNEFYNGQIIVPPKEPRKRGGGDRVKEDEDENNEEPYKIGTKLVKIEEVNKNIEKIDSESIIFENEYYYTAKGLEKNFHFIKTYIKFLYDNGIIQGIKYGRSLYYKVSDVKKEFLKIYVDDNYYSIRVISRAIGMQDSYVRKIVERYCKRNKLKFLTREHDNYSYNVYKARDVLKIFQDSLYSDNETNKHIIETINGLVAQNTNENIRSTLKKIDIPFYIPGIYEKIEFIKNKWKSRKIIQECDRILKELNFYK